MELIALIATTITLIGETIPADTAASPKTKAPSIEREVPLELGVNSSPSYKNSNARSKSITSIKAGNGTHGTGKLESVSRQK